MGSDRHAKPETRAMRWNALVGIVLVSGSLACCPFTKQAEHGNAENLLVIHDPVLAGRYAANWRAHAEHSVPYQREK